MPKEYAVDITLLQAIMDYLTSRPWREVNQMIAGLSQCKPLTRSDERNAKDVAGVDSAPDAVVPAVE